MFGAGLGLQSGFGGHGPLCVSSGTQAPPGTHGRFVIPGQELVRLEFIRTHPETFFLISSRLSNLHDFITDLDVKTFNWSFMKNGFVVNEKKILKSEINLTSGFVHIDLMCVTSFCSRWDRNCH